MRHPVTCWLHCQTQLNDLSLHTPFNMSKHKDNVSIFFLPKKFGSIEDFFVTFFTTITCQEITQLAVSSLLLARKLQGHCLNSSFWKRTLNWAPPPVESALRTMLQKIEIPFGNYLLSSPSKLHCKFLAHQNYGTENCRIPAVKTCTIYGKRITKKPYVCCG